MLPQKRERKEGKQYMNNKKPVTYGQRRQQEFEVDSSDGDADSIVGQQQEQSSRTDVDDSNNSNRQSRSKLFRPLKGVRSLLGRNRSIAAPARKSPLQTQQKSEEMTKEPSAEDIGTVCAFTGTNASLAARYLKVGSEKQECGRAGVGFRIKLTSCTHVGQRQQCRSCRERRPRE
jgi:hypothetical protein